MSLTITFLGTSSGVPTKSRNVSATILQPPHSSSLHLIDCGEGTQHRFQDSSLKMGKLNEILITHLHGDHTFGLPGFLCSMSGANPPDRTEISMTGPLGLRQFVETSILLSDSHLAFALRFKELVPPDMTEAEAREYDASVERALEALRKQKRQIHAQSDEDLALGGDFEGGVEMARPQENSSELVFYDAHMQGYMVRDFSPKDPHSLQIKAAPIAHRVFCVGYVFQEADLPGALDVRVLTQKFGVKPGPFCTKLKEGETVTVKHPNTNEDVVIRPEDVIGAPIPGRKVVLLGDTHNPYAISHLASDCDLLVHESTLENSQKQLAVDRGHSVPSMAAEFAKSIGCKRLILSHFSARFPRCLTEGDDPNTVTLDTLQKQAQVIFGGLVEIAEDFKSFEVKLRKESK